MAARKRTPSTTNETKEGVGFRKEHVGRRDGQTTVNANGQRVYVAPTVPDPSISHGPFKVLQRTDGPVIVFDTRAKPGEGAVVTIPIVREEGEKAEDAYRRTIKAAEQEAIRLAKQETGTQ